MGHQVKKGFTQPLGFSQQPGFFGDFIQAVAVQGHGDLLAKGVQQLAAVGGRRRDFMKTKADDAHQPATGGQRHIQRAGRGQIVGELAGRPAMSPHPGRNARVRPIRLEGAGRVRGEMVLGIRQEDGNVGVKGDFHLANQLLEHEIQAGGAVQLGGQKVKRGGAGFALAFGFLLGAEARGQLPQNQGHDKIHGEHHGIVKPGDAEVEGGF